MRKPQTPAFKLTEWRMETIKRYHSGQCGSVRTAASLARSGYFERVGPGEYRLTSKGKGVACLK